MKSEGEREIRAEFIRVMAFAQSRAEKYEEKALKDPCEGEEHCIYYSSYFSCPECQVANAVFDDFVKEGKNKNALPRDFFLTQIATGLRIKKQLDQRRAPKPCEGGECLFEERDFSCEECVLADTTREAFKALK